jgi:predicted ATP-binding protein involved in virulence
MKLSKIEITNFRCFETLTIPLRPDINVFVGVNAAGKTTILDALAIALYDVIAAGGGKQRRTDQGVTLRPTDIHIAPGAEEAMTGRRDFVQFRAQVSDYYNISDFPTMTPSGESRLIEWTSHIQYRPPNAFSYAKSESEQLNDIYRYFAALWQEIRRSDARALIPLPVVAYYRASRRLSSMPKMGDIFSLQMERQDAYQNALNAGADYRAMTQWFYLRENQELRERMQLRGDRDFEFPDLRAVRRALKRNLEHVNRIFFDDTPPSLKVEFIGADDTQNVLELEQLSDGYRNLLAVVLDFARRLALAHPGWDNPLEAPGILLIDEMELHLHPGWQQVVIPNLREAFPNTQLIVTTHSPQVLTTVRKEQVHFLTARHTLEPLPAEIGTYGSESAFVLETVFGIHTRPQNIETVTDLNTYLQLIEQKQHATPEAQALRAKLEAALGTADPGLVRADMRIRQLEILSKRRG